MMAFYLKVVLIFFAGAGASFCGVVTNAAPWECFFAGMTAGFTVLNVWNMTEDRHNRDKFLNGSLAGFAGLGAVVFILTLEIALMPKIVFSILFMFTAIACTFKRKIHALYW
jgi:hypothetical protein